MSMSLPANDDAFREHFRTWLTQHYQAFNQAWDGPVSHTDPAYRRAWEDYLCRHGWAGLGWPTEFGGKALDIMKQAIVHEELAQAGAPLGINLIGHGILAPTLLHFGTEGQKRRLLPGILTNTEIWCQGYSEPGAGSDLAAVRTRAQRTDGGYLLNGHKIWTSFADHADWCFVLARTDPTSQRHKGLSFLLVNMRQEGVRVEPIRQLTGDAEFCEVFFEDVFVESENVVGDENEGWKIAMAAASFERGTYFIPRLVRFRQELDQLKDLVVRTTSTQVEAVAAAQRQRWARLSIDSHVLRLKSRRALEKVLNGEPPGPEGSSTKVHWSEAHQTLLEFALQLLGPRICASDDDDAEALTFQHAYLWSRAETILAGTSEIQRNIIAERVLGLPKG